MLYSKLQYVKNLEQEQKTWEKLKKEAQKGDALTNAGLKKLQSIPKIDEKIKEIETTRKALIVELKDWFESVDMADEDKRMISDYYFNGKSKKDVQDKYFIECFYSRVKKYVYKV